MSDAMKAMMSTTRENIALDDVIKVSATDKGVELTVMLGSDGSNARMLLNLSAASYVALQLATAVSAAKLMMPKEKSAGADSLR